MVICIGYGRMNFGSAVWRARNLEFGLVSSRRRLVFIFRVDEGLREIGGSGRIGCWYFVVVR